MNNNFNFDFEDKRLKKLVDERIAWQNEHPKPWYLVKPKKIAMSLAKNKY